MAQLRIDEETRQTLRDLAESDGESMSAVLDKAIAEYQRKRFFEKLDSAYAALKADPEAWEEELQERRLLANTLLDNQDEDEVWTEDGLVTTRG
jgi:hypothetical protein